MHKKQKKDWLQHLQKVPYFPKRPQACPEQKPEHPSLPDYSKAFSFHFQCRIRSKCDEKKKTSNHQTCSIDWRFRWQNAFAVIYNTSQVPNVPNLYDCHCRTPRWEKEPGCYLYPKHLETLLLYEAERRYNRVWRLVQNSETKNGSTQARGRHTTVENCKEELVTRYIVGKN